MATNTAEGIGIRRNFATLGQRNFEPSGLVQYSSKRNNLWWVDGNQYQPGTTLPYDVGGVSYSKKALALLQFYWDQAFIAPLS